MDKQKLKEAVHNLQERLQTYYPKDNTLKGKRLKAKIKKELRRAKQNGFRG